MMLSNILLAMLVFVFAGDVILNIRIRHELERLDVNTKRHMDILNAKKARDECDMCETIIHNKVECETVGDLKRNGISSVVFRSCYDEAEIDDDQCLCCVDPVETAKANGLATQYNPERDEHTFTDKKGAEQ